MSEEILRIPNDTLLSYTWEDLFGSCEDIFSKSKILDEIIITQYGKCLSHLNGQALQINVKVIENQTGDLFFILTLHNVTDRIETKEKLQVALSEFESLYKYNPNLVYTINSQWIFTNFNDAGLQKLGYAKEEIVGMNFLEVITNEDKIRTKSHFLEVLKGTVQNFNIKIKDKYNNPFTVEITAVPIIINGTVTGVIGTAQDISHRLKTAQQLKESEESHRALFDYNTDPVITYDLEGKFLSFNKATEDILGVKPEELIGKPFLPFIDEDKQEETHYQFQQVLKGKTHQYETSLRNTKGNHVYLHITLIPAFINDKLRYIHCIGKDITLHKQHEEAMYQMAYYDNLTGLGNQRLFSIDFERLTTESENHEWAFWIIDLDRFKFINDHFGYDAGDYLLSITGRRLKRFFKKNGQVYRYGGNEFAVLVPHRSKSEIETLANGVVHELGKSFISEGYDTVLTASIGISIYPQHGTTKKEIVKAADHAMYHAKKIGRNTFQLYSSDIEGLANSDLQMENLLRQAIINEEFILYYQPQFDAFTEKIYGVEALIRWDNKELGMVSPAKFIPIAEETGLIVDIGKWVLEEACHKLAHWQKSGLDEMTVSVNLSLRQFYQSNLIEIIDEILRKTEIKAESLILEITETIAMQEHLAIAILNKLRHLGVQIAIDDFGTGYSSLKYLQNFPINHIKIDKAFIDNIETKEGYAIVAAIIALGHNLEMVVVAEGVETLPQINILKELGCDIFQGYYYSRPMPPEQLMLHDF